MSITLVKKLREETGAGILACQTALKETHGNYDDALLWIKNHTEAHEESHRVASKGLCHVLIKNNQAILFEVNAETDFVGKNEHFIGMINELGEVLIDSKANYPKEALKVTINKQSVDAYIKHVSGIIKENAYLRRFFRIIKEDNQCFGAYTHQEGKVVTLVILNKDLPELAKDIAMQVAANTPTYLSLDAIDQQTLAYEKMMFEKAHPSYDPSAFQAYLSSVTLNEQLFIKNQDITVRDLLISHQTEIIDFFRFELGQGIEDKLNCKLTLPCNGSVIEVKKG